MAARYLALVGSQIQDADEAIESGGRRLTLAPLELTDVAGAVPMPRR